MRPIERMNFNGESAAEIKRLQDNVIRSVNPIAKVSLLDGRLIGPIALTTTFQPIAHGLGRPYLGWFIVDQDAAAAPYSDFSWTQKSTSISMKSTVSLNVYLWVF